MSKNKSILLALLLFCLSISSCCLLVDKQQFQDQVIEPIVFTPMDLSILALDFHIKHNRWPVSKEELVKFQAEHETSFKPVNLDNYTNITFEVLPDDRLKIGFSYNDPERKIQMTHGSVTFGVPDSTTKKEEHNNHCVK